MKNIHPQIVIEQSFSTVSNRDNEVVGDKFSTQFSCLCRQTGLHTDASSDLADLYIELPEPFTIPRRKPLKIAKGFKYCNLCGAVLPLSDFYKGGKANPAGYRPICKKCHLERCKAKYRANQHEKRVSCCNYRGEGDTDDNDKD